MLQAANTSYIECQINLGTYLNIITAKLNIVTAMLFLFLSFTSKHPSIGCDLVHLCGITKQVLNICKARRRLQRYQEVIKHPLLLGLLVMKRLCIFVCSFVQFETVGKSTYENKPKYVAFLCFYLYILIIVKLVL